LPDGIFSNQKFKFGYILEGLALKDVGSHLVYFTALRYILCPFGIFNGYLVYFPPFWYVVPRKIWQPCVRQLERPKKRKMIFEKLSPKGNASQGENVNS
jgi:hypothetical protein